MRSQDTPRIYLGIWIEPVVENAKRVWKALKVFGAPLDGVTLDDFCNRELIYQIGIAPNRIDIMMDIPGVDFSSAWENRIEASYDKEPIYIIGIKDLIEAKKTSNREQDRLDLKNLELLQAKK
ncbi:MAG: hypothetical protein JRI58_13850 [Deltaproteobacteria bacterium]|nr:hypothetical protein [Deltaproteobacteria bacterium]